MLSSQNSGRVVVTRLRGGLGNQMFQYAVGRCVSITQNRELLLDDSPLDLDVEGTTRRRYALGVFDLAAKLLRDRQWQPDSSPAIDAYLVERNRGFCSQVLEPNPFANLCLQGFWQNENYFTPIQDVVRRDFKMKPGPWECNSYRAQIAEAAASVCIHVRRQDYLGGAGRHLGFVGADYYRRAAETLLGQVKGPHFFVFSDDAQWCADNLRLHGHVSIVQQDSSAGDLTAIDFALMTMCEHFVIANSSFSWWAAWLGASPNKVVIAPTEWFRDDPQGSQEIVPSSWCRLAVRQP